MAMDVRCSTERRAACTNDGGHPSAPHASHRPHHRQHQTSETLKRPPWVVHSPRGVDGPPERRHYHRQHHTLPIIDHHCRHSSYGRRGRLTESETLDQLPAPLPLSEEHLLGAPRMQGQQGSPRARATLNPNPPADESATEGLSEWRRHSGVLRPPTDARPTDHPILTKHGRQEAE